MLLWRISDYADLLGMGGHFASGRWHLRGNAVVYLADHPASALLEVLVRLEVDVDELPTGYQLLAVDVPDDIAGRARKIEEPLPANWREDLATTRALGSEWLMSLSGALLQVPSAIVPRATNWLLNPLHENSARISISEIIRVPFDPRLLRAI